MAGLIGVFGGTFDPPHLGHLILAEAGRVSLGLEKVLWVVTAQSPLKDEEPTPAEVRCALVQAAIAGNAGFEVSRADIDRPGPYYSHGTLEWLRARLPSSRFAYLMGEDSLRDLPKWHDPQAFVQACDEIGVMERSGADPDLTELEALIPGLADRVRFFHAPSVDIASSDLRRRVRAGEPIRYLVPDAVAQIVAIRGLYR